MVDICDLYAREGSKEIVEPVRLTYTKGEREVASDVFDVYHVQLPAFRRKYKTLESVGDDPLLQWLCLFEKGYQSERETEMLAERSEGMRCFVDRYGTAIMDPDLIDRYDYFISTQHEEASRRAVAIEEASKEVHKEAERERAAALEQARKEAEQEKAVTVEEAVQDSKREQKVEDARGMKAEGIPMQIISKITGLTPEEIDSV